MTTDIVNEFFRRHYPPLDRGMFTFSTAGGGMERYEGEGQEKRIFPRMVCSDGFEMSVQGHWGAYSCPRDDFADRYQEVEIMCKADPILDEHGGHDSGEERIYGYVPIEIVERVIAAHGGLADASGEIAP
jgi:hypothetical protein